MFRGREITTWNRAARIAAEAANSNPYRKHPVSASSLHPYADQRGPASRGGLPITARNLDAIGNFYQQNWWRRN